MFRLVKEPVAPWPVRWDGVAADGQIISHELTLKFVAVPRTEFNKLFEGEAATPDGELGLFCRLTRGWSGIADDDGSALAFTPENIARLLDYPGFAPAFALAYVNFWQARPQEREKNSAPSPVTPPAAAVAQTGGTAPVTESS